MAADLRGQLQETLGSAYSITRELGGGGMSRVFLARDESLGRDVAIKVLSPELSATLSAERFTREIKLAAALQEPHIVPVLAAGQTAGLPWYSMPYVSGESVRARIGRGRVDAAEAMSILKNVAQALAYAHERGVVHRDIKPENVLLSSGTAVVADFGIAKAVSASTTAAGGNTLTSAGTSIGTPAYMSPEQAVGDSTTDHRADLYSWAVMAYELLSGAHPFARHTTASALVAAHLTETPAQLKAIDAVPAGFADTVMRCLAKNPAERPASAAELLASLDQVHVSGANKGSATARSRPFQPRIIIAAVAALVVLAGLAAWRMNTRDLGPPGATAAKSLAVLPFESFGGDTANAYFAEGIADGLTTALAQLPGIRVAGRSSAARFKAGTSSAKEIGSVLNVSSVLDGTVRRVGDRVRVTAQLTGTGDGLVTWTQSYDREAKDVFALQDDITHAIVAALQGKFAGTTRAATPSVGTTNPDAYDLYLRALYLYKRRGAGLLQSAELLEQAIAKDSSFARAHAALAAVLLSQPYYLPVRTADVLPRARAAAERAVKLEPNLSDAHQALATAHFHATEWELSEREVRTAISLDSTSAEAHYRLGFLLLTIGRTDEAVPEFDKAKSNDPLYAVAGAYLGYAHSLLGHHDLAIAENKRAVDLDSTLISSYTLLGRAYRAGGRSSEALAIAHKVRTMSEEPRILGIVANTVGTLGETANARAIIAKLEALPVTTPRKYSGLAYSYLGIGDTARALDALERAVAADGVIMYSVVPRDRTYDPIRGTARFAATLRRQNLDPARLTK
jgi:TolB-like protein/tetratricopeptide (TPR) repeat protein